jgi:hypothetical protein
VLGRTLALACAVVSALRVRQPVEQGAEQLELPACDFSLALERRVVSCRLELHEQLVDLVDTAGELGQALVPWAKLRIVVVELVR